MKHLKRRKKKQYQSILLWEIGNSRQENEDALYRRSVMTKAGQCGMYAVCDGMGGYGHGGQASRLCVERMDEWFDQTLLQVLKVGMHRPLGMKKMIKQAMQKLYTEINEELFRIGRTKKLELGTTALVCIMFQRKYYVLHIGDCAFYRMKKRMIRVNSLHRMSKHELTKCLGINREMMPDFMCGKLHANEKYLLCSDGFYQGTSNIELQTLMQVSGSEELRKRYERRLMEHVKAQMRRLRTDNMSAIWIWKE